MSPLVLELAVSKWLHDIEDGAELIGKKGTIRTARNIIERLYCIRADNCPVSYTHLDVYKRQD